MTLYPTAATVVVIRMDILLAAVFGKGAITIVVAGRTDASGTIAVEVGLSGTKGLPCFVGDRTLRIVRAVLPGHTNTILKNITGHTATGTNPIPIVITTLTPGTATTSHTTTSTIGGGVQLLFATVKGIAIAIPPTGFAFAAVPSLTALGTGSMIRAIIPTRGTIIIRMQGRLAAIGPVVIAVAIVCVVTTTGINAWVTLSTTGRRRTITTTNNVASTTSGCQGKIHFTTIAPIIVAIFLRCGIAGAAIIATTALGTTGQRSVGTTTGYRATPAGFDRREILFTTVSHVLVAIVPGVNAIASITVVTILTGKMVKRIAGSITIATESVGGNVCLTTSIGLTVTVEMICRALTKIYTIIVPTCLIITTYG